MTDDQVIDGVGYRTFHTDSGPIRRRYYTYVNNRHPPHEGPVHPQYISFKKRLESFVDWPTRCPKRPKDLAAAGFFYDGFADGFLDCVKCFYCDQGVCLWEASDNPFQEHRKLNPACDFMRALSDGHFM